MARYRPTLLTPEETGRSFRYGATRLVNDLFL